MQRGKEARRPHSHDHGPLRALARDLGKDVRLFAEERRVRRRRPRSDRLLVRRVERDRADIVDVRLFPRVDLQAGERDALDFARLNFELFRRRRAQSRIVKIDRQREILNLYHTLPSKG